MISTRNIRVIVAVFAIFSVILFFASSQHSLGDQLQRVKPISHPDASDHTRIGQPQDNKIIDNALDSDMNPDSNTLQGNSPHKAGSEPPYAQPKKKPESKPYKDDSKPKIMADKATSNSPSNEKQVGKPLSNEEQVGRPNEKQKPSQDCNQVDYVVMIDAGSTGSRVHVYEFNTCKSPPVLLSEKFEMLKPGLSSFDTDTKGAAASLDPLLKTAMETVPKDKQGCTPVSVKATAGLRLLGKEKSDNILKEIRSHLENDYPFAVVEGDGISILDGSLEGVFAWVTANYLLGNIGNEEKVPTAAVFDLGGGSTQIVFEPEFGNNEKMVEGEHKYDFTFGDHKFTLYQFSHLGYGLMQARNKINSLIVKAALQNNKELKNSKINNKDAAKDAKATISINNPCIPPGVTAENVQVDISDDEIYLVNFKGPSVASGAQCRFLAEQVLNKDAECTQKPCSFNGVHQPSLTKTIRKNQDMYVFSFFYDRTNPLGFPSSFTVEELSDLAKVVCNGDQLWKEVLLDDHVKQLNEEPQWCLDLSFITAMLHTGYDIPLHRELRTAKTIDNNELGWCLGASLPLLDKSNGNWKCRIKETTNA